jgi:hypothetical protein
VCQYNLTEAFVEIRFQSPNQWWSRWYRRQWQTLPEQNRCRRAHWLLNNYLWEWLARC